MKTRILFLTLLTSISILLITNGLAFAEQYTGCIKSFGGGLYKVKVGTEPKFPCRPREEEVIYRHGAHIFFPSARRGGIPAPQCDRDGCGDIYSRCHSRTFWRLYNGHP